MNINFSEHEEGLSKGKKVTISWSRRKLISMMRREEGEDVDDAG